MRHISGRLLGKWVLTFADDYITLTARTACHPDSATSPKTMWPRMPHPTGPWGQRALTFAADLLRRVLIAESRGHAMQRFATGIVLSVFLVSAPASADEGMSMETSWENVPRCVGRIGKNATMMIKNAPRGTSFISATLTFGPMELGGERVPLAANGIVPEGAIHLMAPCTPGTYRWTIRAEDAHGRILGIVQTNAPFP